MKNTKHKNGKHKLQNVTNYGKGQMLKGRLHTVSRAQSMVAPSQVPRPTTKLVGELTSLVLVTTRILIWKQNSGANKYKA